ncbi:unnamed protein product [Caenorhabditis bovis]|uniref:Cadherin domain-containing protein n=1 Tax=Caenorhabditis bovis TaxID=2654633 RepID=A0A8S1FAQ0_9PELO|nr:unnamed protein product [Caenorhabditis bovis]
MMGVLPLLCLIFATTATAKELLELPTTTFKIPRNAQEGDVIFGDGEVRAKQELTEPLNLQLDGSNPLPVAINNSLVDPGEPIRFILVNKNAFENGKRTLKIQAIGVISGNLQETPIKFEIESNSELPHFVDVPRFVIKNDFHEKESAIVKMTSTIPEGSTIQLVGEQKDRVRATFDNDSVMLETVPCEECPEISFPVNLMLVVSNEDNHVATGIVFIKDEGSQGNNLKIDKKLYKTVIEEHTADQEKLLRVTATGNTSEILYSLRDASGLFSIHPKEGILSILHPEFLTISSFGESVELTVIAFDGHNTDSSKIVVEISPEIEKSVVFGFPKDEYILRANMTQSNIGNIKAVSPTGKGLIYHVTEGPADLYKVDENGDVFYLGEKTKEGRADDITVTVQIANDGLRMAVAMVNVVLDGVGSNPIALNDEADKILTLSIDEEPGVIIDSIQFLDKDGDEALLKFIITNVTGIDMFGNSLGNLTDYIDVKSGDDGDAHILVKKKLDEKLASIQVIVEGEDEAHPNEPTASVSRTILIEQSDSPAKITDFNIVPLPEQIEIPRASRPNSFVYKIIVVPSSIENLKFTIEPDHLFQIDSHGEIRTTERLSNEKPEIPFRVVVENEMIRKNVSSIVVLPKKRDARFTEDEYNEKLMTNTPIGTIVARVLAKSAEDEPIEDDFVLKGSHAQFFRINGKGEIKTSEEIGTTDLKQFDMLVALKSEPKVNAQIHITREQPRTSHLKIADDQVFATVYDNLPPNSFVARIEAPDEKDVAFKLTSDDSRLLKLFAIDNSGIIRSTHFLNGAVGMHHLGVLANTIDNAGVRTANATVIIDVLKSNECAPKFKPEVNNLFYIKENSQNDTLIGNIEVENLNSKCDIKYGIYDSETKMIVQNDGRVRVDEITGEIRTAKEFDYEKTKRFNTILAIASGRNHMQKIGADVEIMDQDDYAVHFEQPQQTVEIEENAPTGTVVATVRAIEMDHQPVFYHLGSRSPPQFSLHSTSGQVTVEQAIDRESDEQFVIEIGASNAENTPQSVWPTMMKLVIRVKDVNDNGPKFDKPLYNVVIDKDIVVGSKIVQLHASDPDVSDERKKLDYTITSTSFEYRGMSRNTEEVFDVKRADGVVFNVQPLRNYVGGVFHIQTQVNDLVDGSLGKSSVRVFVHDDGDVLTAELGYKPSTVTPQVVDEMADEFSNATGLTAVPKRVVYRSPHGLMSPNAVDLEMIFFNKSSSEIVVAENMLALCEKQKAQLHNFPVLRKHQTLAQASLKRDAEFGVPIELVFIIVGFVALLAITLSICGLMVCYDRTKYQREKRQMENDAAIKEAIKLPPNRSPALISFKHYPSPTPDLMHRPIPNGDKHMYKPLTLNERVGSYAVQQASITVAENEEKIA